MTIQTYPAPKSQVTSSFWRYTATGGETTLTGIDNAGVQLAYLPGQEQVYLNGVMLMRGTDYTATNGTSIVGLSPLTASDYIQVITYSNFTVTNIPVGSISGAITNLQLANSTFTIGSTLINLGDTKNTIAGLTLTSPTINNPIVGTQYSTSVPLTVKGATGQAVNLQEWQDSSANVKAYISSAGNISTTGSISGGSITGSSLGSSGSISMPNNSNTSTNKLYMAGGDTNHYIYSTGSGGNAMVFGEYGNFSWYNTSTNASYMNLDSGGNLQLGSGYSTANSLRYFDIYNQDTNGGSGSIIRLITQQSSSTSLTTVDMVKYKNGTFVINNNDSAGITAFGTAGTERMRIDSNGYLLIGYTSSNGSYKLQVNSQIFATSSSIATSDAKFKENVDTIKDGLSMIDALNPVAFNWKKHDVHNFVEGKTVGFIAQEVQEALKDYEWVDNIVKENKNEETGEEFLGLAETHIIPLLVSAVKELSAKVKALEAK